MKYSFYFLIASVLFSCNNEPRGSLLNNGNSDPTINASVFEDLSALIEDLKTPPQLFDINDQNAPSTITGEKGTVINFNANSFTDSDGNPVTSGIIIELQEYLSLSDMMKNNIQTTSSGQLLVTGGSFNLSATDNSGNSLSVAPWSIGAELPILTDISGFESDMRLFVGQSTTVNGMEQIDWNTDTNNTQEFWLDGGIMNFYGIDLGLSNCDVLYDMASENPTQFSVYVADNTNPQNYVIWMFINDFPSVIYISSPTDDGLGVKTYDGSIPVGLNATLLAIGVDDDNYLKFGTLDISVQGDDVFTITTDYGTSEVLSELIDQLGAQ